MQLLIGIEMQSWR